MTATRTLDTPEVSLAYDVRGPLPTADGQAPLFLIGAPMDASCSGTPAGHVADRTVVTDDPRGLGRSTRTDGPRTHQSSTRTTSTASSRRSAARSRCSPAAGEL